MWLIESKRKKPKALLWNDEVNPAVKRKEATWKVMLGARNEEEKEKCLEV